MEYKRQTSEIQYKGRAVDNPAKRLAAENKAYKARDAKFESEWKTRGREYKVALDEWNQNLAAKDQEEIDFWKTVTPAATKLLSETIPTAMKVKAEMDDNKAMEEYNNLSTEEKIKVRNQALSLFNASDDVYDRRKDLEDQATKLGYTEYAALLNKLNKRGDTRIFRELISGELKDYRNVLRDNLSDTSKKYTYINADGVEETFTGADVGDDPLKLKAFLDQNKIDFNRRVQVGGINTKLILGVTDEQIDSWNTDFAWREGNRIRVANAKEEIHKITSNIPVDISMHMGTNAEGGLTWNIDGVTAKDGTPITIHDKFETMISKIENEAKKAGIENPTGYAKDQLAKGLQNWVLGLDPDNQEAGWEAVDAILGTGGTIPGMTIVMKNGMSFAQMDKGRFGVNGNWKASLGVPNNTLGAGNDMREITQSKQLVGTWFPDTGDKSIEDWKKENPLVDVESGRLNVKWKGTWQYKLAEATRTGDPKVLQQVIDDTLADFNDKGITDPFIIAKVNNWQMPKDPKSTKAFLLKNWDSLVIGNEIDRSSLSGLDESEATIEFLRSKGVKVVDEIIGSNGSITRMEQNIMKILKPIGNNEFTAGKESILDEISAQVIKGVQGDERYGTMDEDELIDEWTNSIMNETFVQAQLDPSNSWYINKENGNTPNKFKHAWWNPKTRQQRNQQLREAEARINFKLKSEDIDSTNTDFFDKEQTLDIVNKYNKNGSIDFSVLNTIAISGEDTFTALNNHIARLNEQDPSLGLQPLVPNETMNEFLNTFDAGDIQTIYKVNGNKGSNTPSITGARLINDKVNEMITTRYSATWNPLKGFRKVEHILPKQTSVLRTLEEYSGGDVSSNQDGRLGIYGIPEDYLVNNVTKAMGFKQNFDKQRFLSDRQYQKQVVTTLISKETERQFGIFREFNEGDIYSSAGASDQDHFNNYRDGSVLVRNILHTLTTGQPLDSSFFAALQSGTIDLETFNNNSTLLQTYANNFSGGFVPNRRNPNYY